MKKLVNSGAWRLPAGCEKMAPNTEPKKLFIKNQIKNEVNVHAKKNEMK